jgi:phosphoglycerate dehydrogenase-like enzyme
MTDRGVVTYSGPADEAAIVRDVLGASFDVRWVPPEPDAVARSLSASTVFLDASMRVRVTSAMVDAAPRLRLVVTATTGADHIDADALARRAIPLLTLKGQTALLQSLTPAAEHSWLLLMACARRLPAAYAHARAGAWDRTRFPGLMLRGRTLGIIGCGRIGGWMARYGAAFGMTCLGHDPYVAKWPDEVVAVDREALFAASDIVTLHVHLTPETRGMLGRREIESMKPGAILINTSRGELVDEAALLKALDSGRLAAAGLDVLSGEPEIADHPLRRYAAEHDNLIITPHIGGFSPDALRVVLRFSAERIVQHLGSAS